LLLLLLLVVQPQQPSPHLGRMALVHMASPALPPLLLTVGYLLPMCLRPVLLLLLLS
jgi:hypothetical protein